jgi:hypothetical protein
VPVEQLAELGDVGGQRRRHHEARLAHVADRRGGVVDDARLRDAVGGGRLEEREDDEGAHEQGDVHHAGQVGEIVQVLGLALGQR